MAYAALLSLTQVLENTLHSPSDKHRISYEKQQIESLLASVTSIVDHFRVHSWQRESDGVHRLEAEIRDAAYKAEDLVKSRVSEHFYRDEWFMGASRRRKFSQQLRTLTQEIDSIKEEVMKMVGGFSWSIIKMVGFVDELSTLSDRLTNHYDQRALGIIPIVGMVGSGKTTLARQLYNDPAIKYHFQVRAWVTVSSNYQPKKVLLELLGCIKVLTEEMYAENYDLETELHKCLSGPTYLIVMDDVWGTEVWDEVRMLFPNQYNGSRILLTTRESSVADFANSDTSQHHHKRPLNGTESWDLMRHIVFGSQSYNSPNLEEVGKKIATRCMGLPLSIVIISGLLFKDSHTKETWESVAENINSTLVEDEQCSELLSLMYARLPHHLKACFLYTGVTFGEDFEISVSKLVKLWIAKGFLEPSGSESLEEVGEKYLTDLIARRLVLISTRSSGKIKTCSIHDLIREFCLRKAQEENFIHPTHGSSETIEDPRRISCPSKFLGKNIANKTFSLVRHKNIFIANDALCHCILLRVLDMDKVCSKHFPHKISKLVCLRYVSLWCQEEELHIPKSICKSLQNLQTLIILQSSNNNAKIKGGPGVHLPVELWSMQKLRYLKFLKCYLPCPPENKSFLENLHTLSKLSSSSCSVNFFERIPNLKKLGVYVEKSGSPFCLGNVGNLPKLEKLEVVVDKGSVVSIPENFTLPQNLKKLTLNGTKLPWKDMKIVASLHNLEELKLTNNAFRGQEWEPEEDEFRLLKSLTLDELDLEYWKADKTHFPKLEHLTIWGCRKLKEISEEIGHIDTLEMIELDDASPHAVTWAKDIQQYHQELETDRFQVFFYYIWSILYQQRQEAKEAFERRKEEEERRKREEERRKWRGGPVPEPRRASMFDHRSSFDTDRFHRTSFPSDGIGGPSGGIHRSFDMFTGPAGDIRGTTPSEFGGSRFPRVGHHIAQSGSISFQMCGLMQALEGLR